MIAFKFRAMAVAVASIYPITAFTAIAAETEGVSKLQGAPQTPNAGQPVTSATAPTSRLEKIDAIEVVIKRLDEARNGLSPETGSSIYRFGRKDIEALPFGDNTPLNQVLLQAPGVAQDSYGQLHVRGDHGNLQYRVNGVVIPEPISGFGQSLDTRFAQQISVLTGALPAQYGYRTAGVIDIQTKGNAFENGGSISYLGGSHHHQESGLELSGSKDAFSFFLTGSYLRNNLGIENPIASKNAIHDATTQWKNFGNLSYVLGNDSRINFVFGNANNKFQIPNVPGQSPSFTLDGVSRISSENFDARQREKNQFQILSYQSSGGAGIEYQVSVFNRYSDVAYRPDPVGDLTFKGIAANIFRRNQTAGTQADLSYKLSPTHTLRTGLFYSREQFKIDNTSQVFSADTDGNQLSSIPLNIVDNTRINGHLYGVYLQDEWKPTDKLTVNYGARFDQVSTIVNENQLSPRLGVVYDVSPQTRVHAGYARYFTPPPTEKIDTTSIALFQNTTNALPSDADTSVKSERSNYYDIGLSHQLTPSITLGLDGYYRDVRHLQDEGQFGNALIFSAFNFERGKIYGLELSGTYKKSNFTAYINAGFSSARGKVIESGQFNFDQVELDYINKNWVHLDHEQRWSGSAGLSYKLGSTQISLDALYGSGLRNGFANTEHLPGYTQVNLGLLKNLDLPGIGKLDVRFALINAFDKTYQIRDGSGIGVGAPQFGPRRALYAGISKNF